MIRHLDPTALPSPKRKRGISNRRVRHGFTLVELLVVIAIIVILMSAVIVASTTLITKAKVSNTQALLTVVRDAVEQFKREQEAAPTITRARQGAVKYRDRYGLYPPDELEVFTPVGIPGSGASGGSLATGGAEIVPAPPYDAMRFYTKGLTWEDARLEHRDLAAMVVTIQTLGDVSASILGGIQNRYWRPAPLDDRDKPALFLDRPDTDGHRNDSWDSGDFEIRYIIDVWGTPLRYFAQRDRDANNPPEPSSNHEDWNEVSTTMVRLNGGRPVIMSYGPNGREQLTQEAMGDDATASLVADWVAVEDDHPQINHHLNADNVYADPTLKEKLVRGTQ